MMHSILPFAVVLAFSMSLSTPALAKKKDKQAPAQQTAAQQRVGTLSAEDARLFDSLSKKQKDLIAKGEIEEGFNAWMVKLALGEPYYATEHHAVFTDYEEVWLYTKPDIITDVKENRIIDRQTNWPTVHRKTYKKSCRVGDFFVLWDRGVVQAVKQSTDQRVFGSCTVETQEAFLPIVDGKPVEPK